MDAVDASVTDARCCADVAMDLCNTKEENNVGRKS